MKVNQVLPISQSLQAIGRLIGYYPDIAKAIGDVKTTVFLCQFLYWEGKQHDKQYGIYKTQEEIYNETGLGRREQERARKRLKSLGILTETKRSTPAKLYFKFHWNILDEIVSDYVYKVEEELDTSFVAKADIQGCMKLPNKDVQNRNTGLHQTDKQERTKRPDKDAPNRQPIYKESEITTKNTTKTTNNKAKNEFSHPSQSSILDFESSTDPHTGKEKRKKVASKKEKGIVQADIHLNRELWEMKTLFESSFYQQNGLAYSWEAKDWKHLKGIHEKLCTLEVDQGQVGVKQTFEFILNHLPEWYKQNAFAVPAINSGFNMILTQIKNQKHETRSNNGVSEAYIQNIVNNLTDPTGADNSFI